MECCPSLITPEIVISNLWQMLAASCNSGTKSSSVAPIKLRATSTSPEPQSRRTASGLHDPHPAVTHRALGALVSVLGAVLAIAHDPLTVTPTVLHNDTTDR